jgi:hypothetical protein
MTCTYVSRWGDDRKNVSRFYLSIVSITEDAAIPYSYVESYVADIKYRHLGGRTDRKAAKSALAFTMILSPLLVGS